jgi:integrase
MEFTKQSLAALSLPDGKSEHFEWDPGMPGLGIRLRSGGSKTWVAQYRVKGKQRRESLGDVRKVGIEDARKIARNRFAQVELGVDPGADRASRARAELTLGKVVSAYVAAREEMWRPSSRKPIRYYLEVLWKPLHDRPIETIKRADIAARLHVLAKENGRVAAARARANLSALYNWAAKEGFCESNPAASTNDPAAGIQPRERVLNDAEIAAVWQACRDDDFGKIVRLLILTGCRRDEIGKLQWREVDLEAGTITIPGSRTKNHRALELALPSIALDILRATNQAEGQDYIFSRKGKGFGGWSWSMIALHGRITHNRGRALEPWVLHDLRRTFRTGLGRIGIAPHIAELCINHVKGGVEAIYDRYTYQPQIKAALAAWAAHLDDIVEGRTGNVVPLRT